MTSNETLVILPGHSTLKLKHSNPGNWWKCPFPGWEPYPGTPGVCIWEYFLFCAPEAFVMMKTYFMTGNPFGQLITQSNRCVQTMLWLPGVCLGTVSACTSQVFCGLVNWGLVFKAINSWVSLCKLHPLLLVNLLPHAIHSFFPAVRFTWETLGSTDLLKTVLDLL